jgi:lipopolysaccharide transport system permease protein
VRALIEEIFVEGRATLARQDVLTGAARWRLWIKLGWNDIVQKYRRSIIGPLWLTASTAVMVLSLGLLYAKLFKTPIDDFLPFLCVGLLMWNYLSSFLQESGTMFTSSESYIKQIRLPYSVYVYRAVWSKIIILAHNFVIYFAVILYFQIWPGMTGLLAIPGFLLLTLNGALASMLIGMISTRFRDIPQLINSVMQIVFFITPIMWKPELLKEHLYIVTWNPFFLLIDVVRAPLLGGIPSTKAYVAVLLITLANLIVCGLFFSKFRARIAYWV